VARLFVGLVMGGDRGDVRSWFAGLEELHERFVHRFSRSEPRESALAYMRGLVAPLERKNGWTLAEEAGHAAPDRMHRLLNRCDWEADEVLAVGVHLNVPTHVRMNGLCR
jgi:SRSO17 transposase